MAAEFGIAAGILQVAGAGVALSKKLYEFGTTAAAASDQTAFIAKNVGLFSRVLKHLSQEFRKVKPEFTEEALKLAWELHDQSFQIFDRIDALLPKSNDRAGLSGFLEKLLWNFRKPRVDYLVAQLEYLKSTTSLLLQILSSTPKIRKWRYW